jgi:hypothetical protein
MEVPSHADRLVVEGSIDTGGGAMKKRKAKILSVGTVAALVAAGLLAAVAMAWPQAQARPQQRHQEPRPAQVQQPALVPGQLPGGGPTQSDLNFAE